MNRIRNSFNDGNNKAALYVRVSTNYQIDKDSLPFQRKELKDYAKYVLGITDFEVFEDAGYSGKNTDRPAYQRMIERCRNGEFKYLIVWKIDRISRNLLDFAYMYEELKKHNVTFISKNEQFDTSTAMGEAMLKIILIFAELERKMTSERVSAIMIDRANKGLWNGARMPIGYRWSEENKYPVIDEDEAITVKFIYDKYEEIKSCTQISRMLNDNNIKTKRGGRWTSKTVCDIIRSPFYIGTYRYNIRESARGAMKPESEWVVIEDNHPGIIDKEQWKRCNEIMDNNAATRKTNEYRSNNRHCHIFGDGILKCGLCGANFNSFLDRPRINGWRPSAYRCGERARSMRCPSKCASDVAIGPFIFNYIANLVRMQKNFKPSDTVEKIELSLLKGEEFKDIKGIEFDGLQAVYNALIYKSLSKGSYAPRIQSDESTVDNINYMELEVLKKEKEKTEKAIKRLFDLYLFDAESMTEKEYVLKKKELTEKLNELTATINQHEKISKASHTKPVDISFAKKATAFLISQRILSKKHIDYVELAQSCDPQILKEFIMSVVDHAVVINNKVQSITFKNGLEHKFIYK